MSNIRKFLNKIRVENKSSILVLSAFVLIVIIWVVLVIKKNDGIIPQTQQSQKSEQDIIWKSLNDAIGKTSNLDKEKLESVLSQIQNDSSNNYHTAQFKLEYGGIVVSAVTENDFVLTIDLKGEEGGNFERKFTFEERQRMETYLYNQGRPTPMSYKEIKEGDIVNIMEITNLLNNEDKRDLLIIQVERNSS